jgi:hypothetical protein
VNVKPTTLRLVLGALALGAMGALVARRGEDIRTAVQLASARRLRPGKPFAAYPLPPVPDYSRPENWAALPDRQDLADAVPAGLEDEADQAAAPVDAFFVHPTTLFSPASWNAPGDDPVLSLATDQGTIKHQASVFNASARVYAPRYRQATLYAFLDREGNGTAALDLAYEDVRAAFAYYLEHYNQGRPLIVAGHSQGSWQAFRLLQEFFAGRELAERLVAAYLPGLPLPLEAFADLRPLVPCDGPEQTGCVASWNTFAFSGNPALFVGASRVPYGGRWQPVAGKPLLCVNPLTWRRDGEYASAELNRGGVLGETTPGLRGPDPQLVDAQCVDGILRIHEPLDPRYRVFLLPYRHYHTYDYNLFYMNIRENVRARARAYIRQRTTARRQVA